MQSRLSNETAKPFAYTACLPAHVTSLAVVAALQLASAACSSSNAGPGPSGVDASVVDANSVDAQPAPSSDAAGADTAISQEAGGQGDAEADSGTYVESVLTLDLFLESTQVDSGAPVADAGGDADDGDAAVAAPTVTTLTITARDGSLPVVTDLWLYTLDGQGNMTPLAGFTSTQPRKSPRRMLPATIAGTPSGLTPADDGSENGTMTCSCGSRGTLDQGAFVSGVTGTVTVTLPSAPTTPILVVAAVEDERYAGAAVINPDGSPGSVPAGVGTPETHTWVSFSRDVAPVLKVACIACHTGEDPTSTAGAGVGPGYNANFYYVTGTADDLVNANFAINEQTLACQMTNPDGGLSLAQCIQSITEAQFLVEPGAPAASDLLQRSRPDEDAGTSPQGLLWYGSRGARYNTKYGDRRMPSTTLSTSPDAGAWDNLPCYFDANPAQFQLLFDWVAQGAISN